jgi:hypothetical protein
MVFQISATLHDALSHLAAKPPPIPYIWIDFLCINQNDLEEKSVQIELMGEIYSMARGVIVWLGNSVPELENFLWLHEVFQVALMELAKRSESEFQNLLKQSGVELYFSLPKLGINTSKDKWNQLWTDYFHFYQRHRWFHRAWIVQEISLGEKAVMLCGETVLPWTEMQSLGRILCSAAWTLVPGLSGKVAYLGLEALHLSNMSLMCQNGGQEYSGFMDVKGFLGHLSGPCSPEARWFVFLVYLLQQLRSQFATDDRDKIYSILGLAYRFLPNGMAPPIRADYHLSAREVYISVSSTLIKYSPRLTLLSLLEDKETRKISDLPSWVPDFSVNLVGEPLSHRGLAGAYNATGLQSPGNAYCSVGNDTLTLEGASFDHVIDVCSPVLEMVENFLTCLEFCGRMDEVYAATKHHRVEALWRTMVGDSDGPTCPAPVETAIGFHDWVLARLAGEVVYYVGKGDDKQTEDYTKSLSILSQFQNSSLPSKEEVMEHAAWITLLTVLQNDDKHEFIHEGEEIREDAFSKVDGKSRLFTNLYQSIVVDKRLYRTFRGHIGLGPASTKIGDEVWLLRSSAVLYIMRLQIEKGNLLIGETYLHGFMHGEIMTPAFVNRISRISIN